MGLFSKEGSSKSSKSDAPLRKSDRRKLRQTVESKLLFLSSSDENEQMQELLDDVFLGNANILVRKVKLPSSCSVVNPTVTVYYRGPSSNKKDNVDSKPYSWPYQSAIMPIIMEVEDGDKKSFIVPTVAFMSIIPIKLPSVVIPSVVSKYICRGADLMRSGIIRMDQNCRPSSLVSIYVHNNPQPFAVGFLTKDTNATTVGPSSKGVAVEILTCYGDDLSRSYPEFNDGYHNWMGGGVSYGNGNFGNVGFVDGKLVHSLKISSCDNNEDDDNDGEEENDEKSEEKNLGKEDENATSIQGDLIISSNEPQSLDSKIDDLKLQTLSVTDGTTPDSSKEESQANNDSSNESSSRETDAGDQLTLSQDEILLQAFHNALLSIAPKTDLPMAVSTFYSKFVLPSRPPNTTIQMKETTFQKFGAFLLYQQQNSQIIKVKGNGSDPVATIVAVNRNHIDLREAKQRRKLNANAEDSKSSNNNKSRLAVIQLYIIQPHIAKLMRLDDDVVKAVNAKSESRKGTGFLTAPECRGILETYVAAENLVQEDDPEYVSLDGPLTDILFRKQRKKKQQLTIDDDVIPSVITRKEMNSQWMESLEKGFAFVQMPGSHIMTMKRGSPPAIQIEVEARTKKKFITRIRGLENYFIDPSTFANDVSKRLACASSTEELISSTKQKSTQVEFQGHIVEELTALLLGNDKISSHGGIKDSPYSVPKGVISLNLRKGVPTKKKR